MPVISEEHECRRRWSPWVLVAAFLVVCVLLILTPVVHTVELGQGRRSIYGIWLPEPDMRDVFTSGAQFRAWSAEPGLHVKHIDHSETSEYYLTLRLGSLTWAVVWD